jgi:antiviral helicase SKI2
MDDLFNLEDFNEQEKSDNTNNKSFSSQKDKEKDIEKKANENEKNEKELIINSSHEDENVETKEDSDKKEIVKIENNTQNKETINQFPAKKEDQEEYDSNEEGSESDNDEEDKNQKEDKDEENESEESEDPQEKENEIIIKEDFQERNKKMQKWAIEDDLDISAFSKIENPPITFPFELDEFQKRSILRLENHENVLVCAHTSSGKTVVAEYGIALGKRNGKRVLYTSPIKALSNQKYREFKKKFGDVGILTGDVSINPDAQCLIMTTEILQSSLYKNSELLNQVEWVIFDEVHYINDNERGHVWEEILILMPRGIGIIMLSATVPNYMEFAQWVGDIKETKVYVQNTLKRVVPLEHQLFIDKNNVFKVKEKDKIYKNKIEQAFNILENNKYGRRDKYYLKDKENEYLDNITYFDKYKIKKKENWRKRDKYQKNYNKQSNQSNPKITKMHYKIEEIVDYLDNKDLCPAVIFVFSIKRITEYSKMLSLKNLVPRNQQNEISNFFRSVVSTMPPEDRKIPQVKELEEILQSGIGVHHAGLLPILKEAIEVLYSRGLIKILFATTSFSIGLNMPTRTVVFTDLYKYNDTSRVILSSSEYLQMCGRAGRRGIDTIGNVFILLSELSNYNEMDDVIGMLEGKGDDVVSKFRLCYRTLLSFFSRNLKDMNRFFRESFLESNMAQKIPEKLAEIEALKSKQKKLSIMNCPYELEYAENKKKELINNDDSKNNNENNNIIIDNKNNNKKEITIEDYPIADYFKNLNKYKNLSREIFSHQKIYDKLHKFPGRILKVRKDIRAPKSKRKAKNEAPKIDDGIYVMLIHAYTEDNYFGSLWCLGFSGFIKTKNGRVSHNTDLFTKNGTFGKYKFFYREYKLEDLIEAYEYPFEIKLKGKKNDSFWKKDKEDYYYIIDRPYMKRCLKELARLKPRGDLELINSKISFAGMNFKELVKDLDFLQKVEERQKALEESKCNKYLNCVKFYEHYKQYQEYEEVSANIDKLKGDLNPENLAHYHEFEIRLKILQNLEYVNEDNSLTLKGKAAREIGTTDCVIITELLTSDILTSLKDEDVIGFLAGFASNKNEIETNDPNISREFSTAIKKFNEIYTMIYELEKENDFEENKYNRRMTFEYSEAMRSWMAGKDFLEILNLTELEEGKLYNLIMRIFLMLEEISNFYSVLGNVEQSKRFSELKAKLMRGIMAIQSLYLQEKIDIDSIGNKRYNNSRYK